MYNRGFSHLIAREVFAGFYRTKQGASLKTLSKPSQNFYFVSMKHINKSMPLRIGFYTQETLKPVFKKRGLMEGKIITHWAQIVGEKFAQLALPEKVTFPKGKKTEGALHIIVNSSGSLFFHYIQDLILEQVNTFFGYKALTKLHMSHGLSVPQVTSLLEKEKPLSSEDQNWIEKKIDSIQDIELKVYLKNLGETLCK